MNKRIQAGFTMIELVVVLAIISVLAAILTPVVGKYVDEARAQRAADEGQSIAKAVLAFNKDTGKWPIFTTGVNITSATPNFQVLTGPGTYPNCDSSVITCSAATWVPTGSSSETLSNELEFNKPAGSANAYTTLGKFAWKGPYLTNIGADPWGNAYIVNAASLNFGVNQAAYVISAGPNSKIETKFDQNIGSGSSAFATGGDDIVARIR